MLRLILPILALTLFALPATGQALFGGSLDTCVGPNPPIDLNDPFAADAKTLDRTRCKKACKEFGKTFLKVAKRQRSCATKFIQGQAKIEILFCSRLAPAMQKTCEQSFVDERKDALQTWKGQTKAKSAMVKPFITQCSASCPD
jgi:hypothetical protein